MKNIKILAHVGRIPLSATEQSFLLVSYLFRTMIMSERQISSANVLTFDRQTLAQSPSQLPTTHTVSSSKSRTWMVCEHAFSTPVFKIVSWCDAYTTKDPRTQADFTSEILSADQVLAGHRCYTAPNSPSNVTAGTNATIQMEYISQHNGTAYDVHYACADIVRYGLLGLSSHWERSPSLTPSLLRH